MTPRGLTCWLFAIAPTSLFRWHCGLIEGFPTWVTQRLQVQKFLA